MNKVKREEQKFYIKREDIPEILNFLEVFTFRDSNSSRKGYKISSTYFDTTYDNDLNEKLDGIMYREKYRVRIYNNDLNTTKFEVKRKLNTCVEKISSHINEYDFNELLRKNYSVLEKYNDLKYVAHRMQYLNYSPSCIVEYNRKAYFLPFNNIRITIDFNLRTYGFQSDLSKIQDYKPLSVQNAYNQILEIKFEEYVPKYILNFLSSFSSVRSSISKYSLSRIHNNTEINGDDPIIPF